MTWLAKLTIEENVPDDQKSYGLVALDMEFNTRIECYRFLLEALVYNPYCLVENEKSRPELYYEIMKEWTERAIKRDEKE